MAKIRVIYDGDCGICERCRRLFERLDWRKRCEFFPLSNTAAYAAYPSLTPESCQEEIKLITPDQKILGGSEAMLYIAARLPVLAPFAWVAYLPPLRQIAAWIYPRFARNRHRLSSVCIPPDRQ